MPDPMNNPDVRWRQRFQSFRKAFSQLSKAGKLAKERELSDLEEQGLIQAFEFIPRTCMEDAEGLSRIARHDEFYGSKDATREAFSNGLIEEGDVWMEMIRSRNETSHTYNEETADQIAEAIISQYQAEFEQFTRRFAALEDAEP